MSVGSEDQMKLSYALMLLVPFMERYGIGAVGLDITGVARQALVSSYQNTAAQIALARDAVLAGRMSIEQFESQASGLLSQAYKDVSWYGKVAASRMDYLKKGDMAEVERQWAAEANHLRNLAREYGAGAVSANEFGRRVDMYPRALREVFNRAWLKYKDSPVYRWHMHPGAVHCVACIEASQGHGNELPPGIYRRGELPFTPGRSPVCLDNCMCWLEAADGDVGGPQIREPVKSEQTPKEEAVNG